MTVTGSTEGRSERRSAGLDDGRVERGDGGSAPWRRFALAALVGVAVVAPGYLWVACDLWTGRFDLLRYIPYEANFYDLQARALLHGHLYLQNGAIGIEAFVHAGRQYTYFGLFPSLLRIPVLALTHRFDAHLTVPSMLLAWIVTAVFSSLFIWRVRCYLRGAAALGWAEAVSLGVLVATISGGTVLVELAATPFVFNEDLAWSVALTLASLFLLLGVLEAPSLRRIAWCGLCIVAANLDRVTTGLGCVLAALLVTGWFGLGRAGEQARRFSGPVAVAGIVPLALGAAVSWLKFGQLFGLPMQDQVFSHVNAYRERFLAVNGGEVGLQFAPSNLLAYLRPDGLRVGSAFPFVTLPASPAHVVGHVLFDRTYPTASVTASMPLLFVLTCWGTITCLFTRHDARVRSVGLIVVGAGTSAGAIFLWGYIADRYLADFVPLLVVGSATGAVSCWRYLQGRAAAWRRLSLAVLAVAALLEIAVNLSVSSTPNDEWSSTQTANFVSAQARVGTLAAPSLKDRVIHGSHLPQWMPAGTLFDVGKCEGLYYSDGEIFSTVPLEQYQHATWLPADEGLPYRHVLRLTFARGLAAGTYEVPLLVAGPSEVAAVVSAPSPNGALSVRFEVFDPRYPVTSEQIRVEAGSTEVVSIVTDAQLHQLTLVMGRTEYLDGAFTGGEKVRVLSTSATVRSRTTAAIVVADATNGPAESALCRRLEGTS